ncbi:hypothetical protein OAB00_01485 [Akkermansiaceae bacterium]|nr:hypothetical protein [Akkermansiaceae bacterium]
MKILLLALIALFTQVNLSAQTKLKGIVILIDFEDNPAKIDIGRYNKLINGEGYTEDIATASLYDYWKNQSRGSVLLKHDLFGYYRAPKKAAWYSDKKNQTWKDYIDLARSALDWIVQQNPDYDWDSLNLSQEDNDKGTFLSINLVTTECILGAGATHQLLGWAAPNGVESKQITASTFADPWDKHDINLYTITHEIGHAVFSFPDTYDYKAKSRGTGDYSLMSANQLNGDIEHVGAPFLGKARMGEGFGCF